MVDARPSTGTRGAKGFLVLVALIAATFVWGMTVDSLDAARTGFVVLSSATLLDTLWLTGAPRRLVAVTAALAAVAVGISVIAPVLDWSDGRSVTALVTVALVTVAPAALIARLLRHPVVDGAMVGAVVSLYLLLGMVFAAGFAAVDRLSGSPFFAGLPDARYADYLYFSYATLTTVGYGDLVASLELGRALAVVEALLGQVYLVTVVALVVGNLGRRRQGLA